MNTRKPPARRDATGTAAPTLAKGDEITRVVFKASRKPLGRRDLHAALEPIVRLWIRAACLWEAPILGDYRFVVFDLEVAPETHVYVQFWSEPLEPVLWEVSSGQWNPPADEWLAGEAAAKIEAHGFTIGGDANNYQRTLPIPTAGELADVAKTVVRIFVDAFGYRGTKPMVATLSYQGRAELRQTYVAFTPEDVAKVFAGLRYEVATPADPASDDEPALRCRKRRSVTFVRFDHRVDDENLYRRVHFTTELKLPEEARERLAAERAAPPGAEPVVTLSVTHPFSGGVTSAWLVERVTEWEAAIAEQRRAARYLVRDAVQPAASAHVH